MMQMKWMRSVFSLLTLAAFCTLAAHAQNDVAASLYGAFTGTTNGNGTIQSPSNAAGVLFELRHISNPLVGYEATYSYNRANQNYSAEPFVCPVATPRCPTPSPPAPVSVPANAHEVTADWIVSFGVANLRPFVLGGGGVLFDVPSYSSSNTSTTTRGVFVYGAGLDWGLLPHIGLRVQYRGNLYEAPNLTKLYTSTSTFTHTAEPMIGAYFRF
jgi:opacity protein-like surface antigen